MPPRVPDGWPQRFCCDEDLDLIGYEGRSAASDLTSLRERGPRAETQELINAVVAAGVDRATILDVGAGVGAVHLALLEAGAGSAIDVDASREYIAAAREEAERRGLTGRVDYRYGDVAELAHGLPAVDVATLDSVICCYPYLPRLIAAVTSTRPRVIGLAYPRDSWWMRTFMHGYNAFHALKRSRSRYFIHRHAAVRRLLLDAGYSEAYSGGSAPWRVATFARA